MIPWYNLTYTVYTPIYKQVLDYLAISVHELANMSERRIERLINPAYSNLPAFLVKEVGLNSAFRVAHCTAAALGEQLFSPPFDLSFLSHHLLPLSSAYKIVAVSSSYL